MARPFLPAIVERSEKKAFRRAQIIRTVGLLGMPEYGSFLEEALDDPSPLVALMAAESLLRPGFPQYVEQVLARFHRFERWHSAPLTRLLSDVGPEAAPMLRSVLANPSDPTWVRIVVAQALRTLRDVESADLAVHLIESEADSDLLTGCLKLLSEVGETRHREPLLPLLQSSDFPVRAQALRALQAAGSEEDLPFFKEALNDPSPWVALEAARGMAALGGEQDLRWLALSNSPLSVLANQVLEE
jgi:HEAT repeat protein